MYYFSLPSFLHEKKWLQFPLSQAKLHHNIQTDENIIWELDLTGYVVLYYYSTTIIISIIQKERRH